MHLILTGATGLVGTGVLDAMIKLPAITKITVLSRRPVPLAEQANDPRVNVIIHKDFTKYDKDVLDQLRDAKGCVWALGISQTKVDKVEYVRITKDYALEAAKAFQNIPTSDNNANEPFNFVYVSGLGATLEPGMFTAIFARVKGETERELAAMRKANPRFHALSIRPAFVDWQGHEAVETHGPRMLMREKAMATAFRPLATTLWRNSHSPTLQLGDYLAKAAMGRWDGDFARGGPGVEKLGEFPIVENSVMWKLIGNKS